MSEPVAPLAPLRRPEPPYRQYSTWPEEVDQLVCLLALTPDVGDAWVVEVGAYRGCTSAELARQCQQRNGYGDSLRLLCVDPWDGTTEGARADFEEWQVRVAPYDDVAVSLAMPSVEAAKLLSDPAHPLDVAGKIGLLFIDGDHRYPAPLHDLRAWWPLVAPGGWVAVHDIYDPTWGPGVRRAVEEFLNEVFPAGGVALHTLEYVPTETDVAEVGHGVSGLGWFRKPFTKE